MVFYPPSWCPKLVVTDIPDSIPLNQFLLDESHGRHPHASSRDSFTCGISGASYSSEEVAKRTQCLARSLQKELRWKINNGSELDRVVCVFTSNTIDIMTLNLAISRCNAISTPANITYTADELTTQLVKSKAQALFTCLPLLHIALRAARTAGIPPNKVYLCDVYAAPAIPKDHRHHHKTSNRLVANGSSLPELEAQRWQKGQATTQIAFLVYSSGTTGLPKGTMISHYNVIANVLQWQCHIDPYRRQLGTGHTDVALGLLP